jgi:putative aldouronate transport system substrate-binding protein
MKRTLAILLALAMLLTCVSFATAEGTTETIQVAYLLAMNAAEERQMVQDAVNELLAEKNLGVQVEFVCIDFASWSTQINLMLADGSVDLFNACFMPSISVLADNGSIAPVEDLFNQYGQGILSTLGDYIDCARVGGVLYGAPKENAFSSALMFLMRKDICDELGIDPETITDFATLTEALKTVKAAYPDMAMIANGTQGGYMDTVASDLLGTEDPLGCLLLGEDATSLTVQNYYTSDTFKNLLSYTKQWSDLGFFMKDPLNAQDGSMAYISNNQAFGAFVSYSDEATAVSVQQKAIGQDIYVAQVMPTAFATTSNVTSMTWCIPSLSTHKEAATKFLNELYTNAELSNLVCNGIEGVHYVLTDEGNITYTEGIDAFTTGWPSGMGTFWPNICITYPWSPDPADIYQNWLSSNDTCSKSPALGFTFDSSQVSDEVTACASIVDKYVPSLLLNVGDTDTLYEAFLAELDNAGIADIIAAKQAQLDTWAAAK